MKILADKLALIGSPVSEEDQVVTLLGSLPTSFTTIITALEARGDGMTMDYVQESLIHHEQKLKFKETMPDMQVPVAHKMQPYYLASGVKVHQSAGAVMN